MNKFLKNKDPMKITNKNIQMNKYNKMTENLNNHNNKSICILKKIH